MNGIDMHEVKRAVQFAAEHPEITTLGKLSSAMGDPAYWRQVLSAAVGQGLLRLDSNGEVIVSWEDAQARADAIKFADGHVPMALETSDTPRKPRVATGRPRGYESHDKTSWPECWQCGSKMRTAKVPYCGKSPDCRRLRHAYVKQAVLTAYGNGSCACVCCGESRLEKLTLDHVQGDGYTLTRATKGGSAHEHYRQKFSAGFPDKDRYQTLCASCNMEKRTTPGECPCRQPSIADTLAAHKKSVPEKGEMASEIEIGMTPPIPDYPEVPEKSEVSGIRELTQGEMFALDLNSTALAEERREAPKPVLCAMHPRYQAKSKPRSEKEGCTCMQAWEVVAAGKLAQKELVRQARADARAAAKEQRARERIELKQQAITAKIAEAEGGTVQLPAVVLRDGTVKHVSDQDAWAVMEMYLDDLMLDCENSGYPPGHALYDLRTVQLGGEQAAIVFDASDPDQMQIASLALNMAKKLRAHSATADVIPVVIAGLIEWNTAWAKMQDSVLNAKLNDPKMSGSDADALKELAADLLREYAVSPHAEIAKNELFKAMGCLTKTTLTTPPEKNGWNCVNRYSVVMTRYAGSDVLDLAAVLRVLPPIPVEEAVMDREREFQAACATVTYTGFRLDPGHIKKKIVDEEAARAESQHVVSVLSDGKITNPKSPDVIKLLPEVIPGLVLGVNRKSKRLSADKGSLEGVIRDYPKETHPAEHYLIRGILDYRHHDTTLGLLLRPLEQLCDHGDSRMRPTVYTIEASTGRTSCRRPNGQQFCYTSSMDILTNTGWKRFPEIDGSELVAQWVPTDSNGTQGAIEFVKPTCVTHEAYDGPMIRISGEHHEQVVTPAHRVYSKTRDGRLMVEPAESWLKHGAVDKIVDRKLIRGGRLTGRKLNDAERLALYRAVATQADGNVRDDCDFIGLAFTKLRKVKRARELGLEVTEATYEAGGKQVWKAKSYAKDCEPWLSLPPKTFNIPALLELDSSELEGFLHEVMIWDGDATRFAAYNQAAERTEAVDAVELAAILSGNSTCRSVKRVAGKDYACVQVFPKTDRWASRTNVEEVPSDGMIHCVTVPSGAIVVRSNGKVIVSGNSRQGGVRACVRADPGFLGISADFEGCEIRVAAALSGDKSLYDAEVSTFCYYCEEDPCSCGKDHTGLHWRTAHSAQGKGATKEHRYQAKRGTFCVPEEGTEILTKRGWLKHDEVKPGDETLGRDTDGKLRWTQVEAVPHFKDAELIRLSSGDHWSAVTTPDHRWVTDRRRDGGNRGRYREVGFTRTNDITPEHRLIVSAVADTDHRINVTPAEAALIAWVYTDGSIQQSPITGRSSQGTGGWRRKLIVSIKQAKPKGITALEEVLAKCGADYRETRNDPVLPHHLPSREYVLKTKFSRELWGRAGLLDVADKAKPGFDLESFVLKLGPEARTAFLRAALDAEGWTDKKTGQAVLSQNEGPVYDALLLAATLEGWRVRQTRATYPGGNAVHVRMGLSRHPVGGTKLKREDAGRADVWCVTTGLGSWVMRQGGNIMLTGNCKLFGGGPETAAAQVFCNVIDMEKTFAAFDENAPVFVEWDRWLRKCYKEGSFVYRDYATGQNYSQPIDGENRMIYRAYSGRNIYIGNGAHAAGNGAIQGTARELLVDGTLLWKRTRWGHYPLLPVHDELICIVPAEEAKLAGETLGRCMEADVLSSPGFPVHIGADVDEPWTSWPDSS